MIPKKSNNLILTNQQHKIFKDVVEDITNLMNNSYFGNSTEISITGAAGTGKTTLSKFIVDELLSNNISVAILAPTHQALNVIKEHIGAYTNITYATLHSFLGLKPGEIDLNTGERKFKKVRGLEATKISLKKVDIIVIDESSMISNELYDFIQKEMIELRRYKGILYLGDKYQLPAIEVDENLDSIPKSPVYDNDYISHYKLTELIRNSDMEVINFVTNIRKMIQNKDEKKVLFEYLLKEKNLREKGEFPNHQNSKIIFYDDKTKFLKDYIKDDRVGNVDDCIVTFTNGKVNEYNNNLRNFFINKIYGSPTPELTEKDLLVVQASNEDFFNSETIEISQIKKSTFTYKDGYFFKDKISFEGFKCVDSKGRSFNYISKESQPKFNVVLETIREEAIKNKDGRAWKTYYEILAMFLDVKFHYSMTIHKSQGSSYNNIWIDCTNLSYVEDIFLFRLFYVASTRAKNKVNILI